MGIFVPFIPDMPTFEEGYAERINGLSLYASGTTCDCLINGISVGGIGHIINQVNGISATMFNVIGKHNGIMIAPINMSDIINGLQLGYANGNDSEARGIQIGIWNVNQKRKLPLINWNFKRIKEQKTNEQK